MPAWTGTAEREFSPHIQVDMIKRIATGLVGMWRGQSPVQRFAVLFLLLLICANIGLSAWFSSRTRQASLDEVVQKAYVISRMVSDAAARSLARDDLAGLDSATAEALKDRDLAAIIVHDKKGNVVLEKAKDNPPSRLNTFKTPIRRGDRDMGTVTTLFSLTADDGRLAERLSHTVLLQWGLFALMAAFLAMIWLRENHFRQAACSNEERTPPPFEAGESEGERAPVAILPLPPPAVPLLARYSSVVPPESLTTDAAECTDMPEHCVPPGDGCPESLPSVAVQRNPVPFLARDLCDASSALQEALSAVSAEEGLRQREKEHARLFSERVCQLQRQAAEVAARAGELIAAGGNIVESVLAGCGAAENSEDAQVMGAASLAQKVSDSTLPVREVFGVVQRVCTEMGQLTFPAPAPPALYEDLSAAAGMAEECSSVMRERVLPALAAARDDETMVAERVSALARLLDELDGRANDIARSSAAVLDMASMARSLGRMGDAGNGHDLLAERMEELAWSMTGDLQALRALTGKTVAMSETVVDAARMAQSMVGWAGKGVEDIAAASVLEGELLRRSVSLAGNDDGDAERIAGKISGLVEELQEVQRPLDEYLDLMGDLVGRVSALAGTTENQQLQAREYSGSLAVAGGTLRLAGTFLAELVAEAAQLAELSREAAAIASGARHGERESDLEDLIRQAHERIAHLLASYELEGDVAPAPVGEGET